MNLLEHRLALSRRNCATRRRYVAELEALARRLRADERRLQTEIEAAVEAPIGSGAADLLLERHRKLVGSIAAIDLQLEEAGAALAAAERDLKRNEEARTGRAAGRR